MTVFAYKGYRGEVRFDFGTKAWLGQVRLVRGRITFSGSTPEEAQLEMESAIDAYLASCAREGIEPSAAAAPQEMEG